MAALSGSTSGITLGIGHWAGSRWPKTTNLILSDGCGQGITYLASIRSWQAGKGLGESLVLRRQGRDEAGAVETARAVRTA